jgi:phosphomannomutase
MKYVFDVDGTLTPSRGKIDHDFAAFFYRFCQRNDVYLVTGSDYDKTLEQLGVDICNAVKGAYCCSGNVLMFEGDEIYRTEFHLTDEERAALKNELYGSGFAIRTGNHIEERLGAVNFSIVGRNANKMERQLYIEWDNALDERNEITKRLNAAFPRLQSVVGGETGIDIFAKGLDKAQIAEDVRPFVFFGDKCEVGGNDHSIFMKADNAYYVHNWEETYRILKKIERE